MNYSFNEAGAIMPRSGVPPDEPPDRAGAGASMRPGQSCPGVVTLSEPLRAAVAELQ